ncbi:unnamed protein product [Caenorhabditis bovis]|uniref:Piwi domain-containing protein n=1 Tax=Caenorhabditis bovis TaxID=2654633 RepID=A0A8S1FDA6_9PELO|nr:unnamed protein product [Caenorhabditis bovis]
MQQVFRSTTNTIGFIYDCVETMYASEAIKELETKSEKTLEIRKDELGDPTKNENDAGFYVTIKKNASSPTLNLANFKDEMKRDLSENNKEVSNFINLLNSYHAREIGFTVFGSGIIFKMDKTIVEHINGHEDFEGYDKGVKIIDQRVSNDLVPTPAFSVDVKAGTFFKPITMEQSLLQYFGITQSGLAEPRGDLLPRMSRYVKGLSFCANYSGRVYTCSGLSNVPISQIKFIRDGKEITVAEYLKGNSKIKRLNVRYPGVRVLKTNIKDGVKQTAELIFPLEECQILKNQRVPREKQSLKGPLLKPFVRFPKISQSFNNMQLNREHYKAFFKLFGVSLSTTPKSVTAIPRNAPGIFAEKGSVNMKQSTWFLTANDFLVKGSRRFIDIIFTSKAQSQVENITRMNVIRKLNLKMGGLNYRVVPEACARDKWISNENMLIVSYDVAHPGRVNTNEAVMVPSVVGFSFNGASHKEAFIGDFHYQYPKREQVDSNILKTRMKWMVEKFLKNRNKYPGMILIIRDGVSEGQYPMVMTEELTAIRKACQEIINEKNVKGWSPKFSLVIATKRNSSRFFLQEGNNISNVKPLTVIDRDVTRPNINEAYIVSARAINGTSKPVCYQLLVDEIGFKNMDEFEAFMLALTFHHQICESPISLPEPVYQADEFAKRGNALWKAYESTAPLLLKEDGSADFERMTERLAYWHSTLENMRINA